LGIALLLVAACPATGGASGYFDGSTLVRSGAAPAEGEVFGYTLTLLNGGEQPSVAVAISIPAASLLAGVEGLPGATLDENSRTVRWQGAVHPGQAQVAHVRFVAHLDAGGQIATVRVTIEPAAGATTELSDAPDVETRPAPAVVRVGSVGITAAGAVVLGWLVMAALLWAVLRVARPDAAAWAPIAILLPLAFLSYFAWLGREDARIGRLPTRACTVTDRELDARTASSTSRPRSGPVTVYRPWLALSYEEGGTSMVAQGFGTDSALSNGSAEAQTILTRYALGARIPCAVDDRDTRRAYVERGPGGAYLFALIPVPLLALGLWGLRRDRRRR